MTTSLAVDGKEKALFARYGGAALAVLTVAVQVTPASTKTHAIATIAVVVLGALGLMAGVELIPNSKAEAEAEALAGAVAKSGLLPAGVLFESTPESSMEQYAKLLTAQPASTAGLGLVGAPTVPSFVSSQPVAPVESVDVSADPPVVPAVDVVAAAEPDPVPAPVPPDIPDVPDVEDVPAPAVPDQTVDLADVMDPATVPDGEVDLPAHIPGVSIGRGDTPVDGYQPA